MSNYLREAFKELELLDEEVFPFDKDGAEALQKFMDGDITDDTESIIDPEADSEEELKDSYEGKVVLKCKICGEMQYEDPEDVVIDEDSEYANVGQECPVCYSTDGFKVIGQIEPFCPHCDHEDEEDVSEVDVDIDEGLSASDIDRVKQAVDTFKRQITVDSNSKDQIVDFLTGKNVDFKIDDHVDGDGKSGKRLTFKLSYPKKESLKGASKKRLVEKRETGLADVVMQMLDGEFYDMVTSKKTGKVQSVGRPPIVNADDIGIDDDGLIVRVKNDDIAAKVKEIADKFSLETKVEPAGKYDRDKRARVHIYISEEDWDKDVSDIAFGKKLTEECVDGDIVIDDKQRKLIKDAYKEFEENKFDKNGLFTAITHILGDREDTDELVKNIIHDLSVGADLNECDKRPFMQECDDTNKLTEENDGLHAYYKGREVTSGWVANDGTGWKIVKLYRPGQDNTAETEEDVRVQLGLDDDIRLAQWWVEGPYTFGDDNVPFAIDDDSVVDVSEYNTIYDFLQSVIKPKALKESVENVTVETESDTIKVEPDSTGKVVVETEPKDIPAAEAETIVPVDADTKTDIDMNDHNFDETSMDDIDVDEIEIDSDEFDTLGESYLKKVYGNVESYKTVSNTKSDNKRIIEGIITFTSGKKAKTRFMFENVVKTRSGKIKFIGENLQLSNNKKAFTITANLSGKKGMIESFNYNYIAKDASTGKSVPLYGTIKK